MLSAFISDSRNRILRLTFVKVIPDIAIVTATTTTGTKDHIYYEFRDLLSTYGLLIVY